MLCGFKSKKWELEFFVKNIGRRTVHLLVDLSYENSATYEILSFKITSILCFKHITDISCSSSAICLMIVIFNSALMSIANIQGRSGAICQKIHLHTMALKYYKYWLAVLAPSVYPSFSYQPSIVNLQEWCICLTVITFQLRWVLTIFRAEWLLLHTMALICYHIGLQQQQRHLSIYDS